MKKAKILKWVILAIAIAINVFIIVNAFVNGEASAKESGVVVETAEKVVNDIKPGTITEANHDKFAFLTRKLVGHFLLFVGSGLFSTWSFYLFLKDTKVGFILYQTAFTLSFGFVVALLSEFIQLFIDGRTGAWRDVGIDSCGYFIGFSVMILVILFKNSKVFVLQNYKKKSGK